MLDKETGLVWEQSPGTFSDNWSFARGSCLNKGVGGRLGWRLPSVAELASLVDPSVAFPGPTLPAGHPFSTVTGDFYWSATKTADFPGSAFGVFFQGGTSVAVGFTENIGKIWCVRGAMQQSVY